MSRDESPRSRAALADATDHREREAADLRAYAHHREPRARERLIRSYLPLANSIARRFDRGQRVPLEDLQQIAAIGLLKALDRYDPAHGAAFSTFAVPTMEGEILRYFRDFTWTVRPPRELQERAIRIERERNSSPMISGATRPHASSPHRSAAHPKNSSTPPKRPTRAPVIRSPGP